MKMKLDLPTFARLTRQKLPTLKDEMIFQRRRRRCAVRPLPGLRAAS
jgi:hypothetical protein